MLHAVFVIGLYGIVEFMLTSGRQVCYEYDRILSPLPKTSLNGTSCLSTSLLPAESQLHS